MSEPELDGGDSRPPTRTNRSRSRTAKAQGDLVHRDPVVQDSAIGGIPPRLEDAKACNGNVLPKALKLHCKIKHASFRHNPSARS